MIIRPYPSLVFTI